MKDKIIEILEPYMFYENDRKNVASEILELSNWISVENELPEYWESVLTCGAKENRQGAVMHRENDGNWYMVLPYDADHARCYCPAYWQPLPAPPEA